MTYKNRRLTVAVVALMVSLGIVASCSLSQSGRERASPGVVIRPEMASAGGIRECRELAVFSSGDIPVLLEGSTDSLYVGMYDGAIRRISKEGRELWTPDAVRAVALGHNVPIRSISVNSDETAIAVASGKTNTSIEYIAVNTGALISKVDTGQECVVALRCDCRDPECCWVATSAGLLKRYRRGQEWSKAETLGPVEWRYGVRLLADRSARMMLCVHDEAMERWNCITGKREGHGTGAWLRPAVDMEKSRRCAVSLKRAAAGGMAAVLDVKARVYVWNTENGALLRDLEGWSRASGEAAYLRGAIFIGEEQILVWDDEQAVVVKWRDGSVVARTATAGSVIPVPGAAAGRFFAILRWRPGVPRLVECETLEHDALGDKAERK